MNQAIEKARSEIAQAVYWRDDIKIMRESPEWWWIGWISTQTELIGALDTIGARSLAEKVAVMQLKLLEMIEKDLK